MPRSVELWQGATDDTPVPPRVQVRVFEACKGRCGQCGRKVSRRKDYIIEHLIALINGGKNAEGNLGITCTWCKPAKDAVDVSIKSKGARIRAKAIGAHRPKHPLRSRNTFAPAIPNTRYIEHFDEEAQL